MAQLVVCKKKRLIIVFAQQKPKARSLRRRVWRTSFARGNARRLCDGVFSPTGARGHLPQSPKISHFTFQQNLGVAQLVARYLGVVEAASSSLVTQTKKTSRLFLLVFLYFTRVFGTFSVSENPFFLASGFASFWLDFGVSTYLGTYLKKVHFTNE